MNNKLNTRNYVYDIKWTTMKGKPYIQQQKRYKRSDDAIFRVNDKISYKSALSNTVYMPYMEETYPRLNKALLTLSPKEERVIRLRFGLGVDRSYTLDEIGLTLNVTRERIRQIEGKALRLLKKRLKSSEVSH